MLRFTTQGKLFVLIIVPYRLATIHSLRTTTGRRRADDISCHRRPTTWLQRVKNCSKKSKRCRSCF